MIGPKTEKPTSAEERRAYTLVTARDDDLCQRCLRNCGPGTSRDHRKARSRGGLTVASNLQVLGGTGTAGCHGWKEGHPQDALAEGWSVPSWADPADWPARRWLPTSWNTLRPAWVLYTDGGDWDEISEDEARDRMGLAS